MIWALCSEESAFFFCLAINPLCVFISSLFCVYLITVDNFLLLSVQDALWYHSWCIQYSPQPEWSAEWMSYQLCRISSQMKSWVHRILKPLLVITLSSFPWLHLHVLLSRLEATGLMSMWPIICGQYLLLKLNIIFAMQLSSCMSLFYVPLVLVLFFFFCSPGPYVQMFCSTVVC